MTTRSDPPVTLTIRLVTSPETRDLANLCPPVSVRPGAKPPKRALAIIAIVGTIAPGQLTGEVAAELDLHAPRLLALEMGIEGRNAFEAVERKSQSSGERFQALRREPALFLLQAQQLAYDFTQCATPNTDYLGGIQRDPVYPIASLPRLKQRSPKCQYQRGRQSETLDKDSTAGTGKV